VSPGSVTAAVTDLIGAGYLHEAPAPRDGDSTRGRPPVALAVRPDAGFVAGIKFAPARHTAVIHDFAGNELGAVSVAGSGPGMTAETLFAQAEALLGAVLTRAGLSAGDLVCVGIGVPGFVDREAGQLLWSALVDERNLPLAALLTQRLGVEVIVDNDAHLVALAELWFGSGRAVPNFAVVTIEHGVGMGLVLNNQLYRGARGLGTELGHMKVQLDGALCQCGQRGCLEAYISDYALLREARTALRWPASGPGGAELLDHLYLEAKAGNDAARSIFRRAGRFLALGLANIVNLFDPELILLSGARMRYDYLYAEEVLTETGRLAIVVDRPAPKVQIHTWGDLIWARGAAALALSQVTARRMGADGLVAAS
ncbi:hypothetical protein LCGC14_2913010, partial [marine sediment metagenome]